MKKLIALLISITLVVSLVGCSTGKTSTNKNQGTAGTENTDSDGEDTKPGIIPEISGSVDIDSMEVVQGKAADIPGSASIQLADGGSQADTDAVKISGGTVTITDEGTYVVSGTLAEGMLIIDAEKTDKVQVVLNGVGIYSSSSAAIYVRQADKLTVTLAEKSVNVLSNGSAYTAIDDNNIDAVLFSKDDLSLEGSGTLAVKSPAGHGVVSKDNLTVKGGVYIVRAANHGFSAKDDMEVTGGQFDLATGKDGIHAENNDDSDLGTVSIRGGAFKIYATGDGVSAGSALVVDEGNFVLVCGGGSKEASGNTNTSAKGLKAASDLHITGGTYTIDSADDAIHSNTNVTIGGGSFTIAAGDDGIHADENTVISGGNIAITESYEGIEGLTVDISGGEISIVSSDDGLNAAGGADGSGMEGPRGDDWFGGGHMKDPHGNDGFGGNRTEGIRENDRFGGNRIHGQWNEENKQGANNRPDMQQPVPGMGGEASSDAYITISGGTLMINAEGDGIDSNGDLTVSGGQIFVSGPVRQGNGALDYERTGTIKGGTFIAVDCGGMSMNFSSREQGSILLNVGTQSAGSSVEIADEKGNVLAGCRMEKEYSTVVISCSDLKIGSTYTVTAGNYSQTISLDSTIYGSSQGNGIHMRGM